MSNDRPLHPSPRSDEDPVTGEEYVAFSELHGLTLREIVVVIDTCRGLPRKAVARKRGIGLASVNRYCERLHRKLAVRDRVGLVVKLFRFVLARREKRTSSRR
jgi:DNA-binding CsgD family transcriptional regulator